MLLFHFSCPVVCFSYLGMFAVVMFIIIIFVVFSLFLTSSLQSQVSWNPLHVKSNNFENEIFILRKWQTFSVHIKTNINGRDAYRKQDLSYCGSSWAPKLLLSQKTDLNILCFNSKERL